MDALRVFKCGSDQKRNNHMSNKYILAQAFVTSLLSALLLVHYNIIGFETSVVVSTVISYLMAL